MEGYHPAGSFGERAAAVYDDQPRGDETEAVALLAELAAGGPVLELGIGTGRIAVPLAAGGLRVDGIDVSLPMLSRLRAKPGGRHLHVAVGDMAELPVAGAYRLVYVVFNTLFNLLSQDEQVRCFARVGEHLEPDGRFVVEAFVPGFLHRLRDQQHVDAETIAPDQVRLDLARHDPVAQRLTESHVVLSAAGIELFPIVTRYAWPAELDLMARLAGLELHQRWGGWHREPFSAESRLHVSVYRPCR